MDINTVNEEMSLAEALQMRADIKTRISQLRSRLNDNAKVQEGETPAEDPLTALLARRDTLSLELSIFRDFLQQASQRIDRYSKTEIKILPTVDVTAMQKTVDAKSKELRQLDAAIQKLNWNTMLI